MAQRPAGGWMDPARATVLARAAGLQGSSAASDSGWATGPRIELSVRVTTDQLGGPTSTVGRRGVDAGPDCSHCGGPPPGRDLDGLLGLVCGSGARWGRCATSSPGWLGLRRRCLSLIEAEIDPLVVGRDGSFATDVRVGLAPATLDDPARGLPD
jgi:hypothetical protein